MSPRKRDLMMTNEITGASAVKLTSESTSSVNVPETSHEQGYENDVLSQFKANLRQVELGHAKLRFVLGEINSILKK